MKTLEEDANQNFKQSEQIKPFQAIKSNSLFMVNV
jgi:hypothetical protein